MSSPPTTIDESEDIESAGVTQDQVQQPSVPISPRSNRGSSGGGSKTKKLSTSEGGSGTQRSIANRRSIHELEGAHHHSTQNTSSTGQHPPKANNNEETEMKKGGDTRLRRMPSGGDPRRNSTGPRGAETGGFRTKTLQDLEASYGSVHGDSSRSLNEIPPSPRSKQESRRPSSDRNSSSGSNRELPPELRRKLSGGADNQRRTSLRKLERAALSSSSITQSPGADKQRRTSLHALEAAALGSPVAASPGAGNQRRTSLRELEAAALGSSGTISPGADNQSRTSLSELEAAALGSSGAISRQEAEKAFISKEKSRLGSYIAQQGSSINKDVDGKTAKALPSDEKAAARPPSSFLKRAQSEGTASSRDGARPLSTKEIESEKRNLDRLRRKDDGAVRPGAYAVATQAISRSNSSTPPTGTSGPMQSLRSLESSVLRKHSVGHSAAVPRNASFRGEGGGDNNSGHQHSVASERSAGSKSEQGLTPGGPRPGAFEAQYSLQPSWITRTAPDGESVGPVSVDASGRHSVGNSSIPEVAEHSPEERNVQSSGWRDDLDSEQVRVKSKRRRRNIVIVAAVAIVAGVAAGIGIAVGGGSGGDSSSSGSDPLITGCGFDGRQVPSILEQCQCGNQIQEFPEGVLEQYYLLRGALAGTMYDSYEEDRYSCSTRNMAVAHVASDPDFDIKTRMQRYLLVFLYFSWDGSAWIEDAGWLSVDSECSWYGISCRDGQVIGLEFANNNMGGDFVREFFFLSSLERVVISDAARRSAITGPLLPEVGLLTNLKVFAGDAFGIIGHLATEIGLATSLEIFRLDAASNALEGTLPSQFGNLTNLDTIRIYGHVLTGSLPTELGKLTNMIHFDTSGGILGGEFPTEMNSLHLLNKLDISGNLHTGRIPDIINFPDIVHFQIGNNVFSSDQSVDGVWNATKLETLDLSFAKTKGSIPESVGSLANLTLLLLEKNRFVGTLPTTIGRLTSLVRLHLGESGLLGSIPSELGLCSSLTSLRLDRNDFSGRVPTELLNIPDLDSLLLAKNDLTGTLSMEFCSQLNILQLSCEATPCPCDSCVCAGRQD